MVTILERPLLRAPNHPVILNFEDPKDLVLGFMISRSEGEYFTLKDKILEMLADSTKNSTRNVEAYRALKWEMEVPRTSVTDYTIKKL